MSDITPQAVFGFNPAELAALKRLAARSQSKPRLLVAAQYILARGSEASSYAGLGALLALAGLNMPEEYYPQIAQAAAGVCALAAMMLKDRGAVATAPADRG